MAEHPTPDQPYTVHEDAAHPRTATESGPEPAGAAQDAPAVEAPRAPRTPRGPDPFGLVAGTAALAVAVLALTGTLAVVDPRWVVAGAAIVVGLVVLLLTLARRPR